MNAREVEGEEEKQIKVEKEMEDDQAKNKMRTGDMKMHRKEK